MPQRSEKFERPEIIRPPSERRSYFLPLTSGCSNNTCAFCSYYGSRLRIRELDEVKQELDALSLYMKYGIGSPSIPSIVYMIAQQWDQKRIFLQDGDALVYPYSKLVEVLQYVNEKFPHLDRIGTYATPQDILRRSQQELETLRELKLSIFYTGVESGDDEVLKSIGKGVNYQPIDPFQSLEELRTIVEKSSFSNCFFSSMHASNYFSVRGRLPSEKQKMLEELEDMLTARDFSRLRPEFLRGL